ncbi:hypothetical protein BV20DRAFT_980102 [Pilatotrama ljubarskyi]|nr:hypothetical protein BV20DRAFT_980102 [Pilatotrama ljubarskyi]
MPPHISLSALVLATFLASTSALALPSDTSVYALSTLEMTVDGCTARCRAETKSLVERMHSCNPGDSWCTCSKAVHNDWAQAVVPCFENKCRLPTEARSQVAVSILVPECAAYIERSGTNCFLRDIVWTFGLLASTTEL